MTSRHAHLALIAMVLFWTSLPAISQSESDYDAPPECRTALSDFIDQGGTEDEAGILLARLRAECETRGGMPTAEQRAAANAAVEAQRVLYAHLLPGGNAPAGTPTWRSIGPSRNNWWNTGTLHSTSTNSGRIRSILQHPVNPDIVYLLTSGGGLWRTANFSKPKPDWQATTDGVLSTSGGAVAFGRTPNVLYLGIGDPFDASGVASGVMVKSTDGGNSWSPFADLPGASTAPDVKVDTSGATDVVLVATNFGLYRSVDNGATYAQVLSPAFSGRQVWSIAKTSAGWIAATELGLGFGGPIGGSASIVRSTDLGATWTTVLALPAAGRITLANGAPGESIVYALAATPDGFAQFDVLKSSDGGINWTPLNVTGQVPTNPNADQPTMDVLSGQAWYNQMLLVDPNDASRNTLYLGGQLSSAKSTDGGATWTLITNWLGDFGLPYAHADMHAGAVVSLKGGPAVVLGTDGGVFITTDGGKSFDDSKNEGLVTELMYSLTASGKNPAFMLSGTQDNGTLLRLPNQMIWNGVLGGDGFGTGWSQANDAVSLGSLYYSFIRRASNNPPNSPEKWSRGDGGIDGLDFYYFFTPIITPTAAADPSGLTFFHKTGLKIYRTRDGAQSWQVIGLSRFGGFYPGGDPNLVCLFNSNMQNLGSAPANIDRVAAGCNGGQVAITLDGGATWVQRNLRVLVWPGYTGVSSITWGNNQTLYVGSIVAGRPVVKSSDAGQTWTVANNGLPFVGVNKLAADWRDLSGNTVYAGTQIGVYRTIDGGLHWTRFGANLPAVDVRDLHISADGKLLRAGTYGRGAWEIAI